MASLTPVSGILGNHKAAHLLRRSTFGPTRQDIENFAGKTASEALTELLQDQAVPDPPVDPLTGLPWLPVPGDNNSEDSLLFDFFKAWFIEQMRSTGTNLTERMTYFYHTHLPADQTLIRNSTSLYYQNALYRFYALGNYKELFTKVCVDNAMLVYIDNTLNDYGSPNENYAREMFELYTIGKGPQIGPDDYTHYTEQDVQEAARVLTGFRHNFNFNTIDPVTSLPRGDVTLNGQGQAYRHDPGVKTFSEKFQNTVIQPKTELMDGGYATEEGVFDELDQLMDMIFSQDETARFICRKLYRFFVYYQITQEIEQDIIIPLADTLRSNNYEIKPVITQLLSSQHFYDMDNAITSDDHIGALIKSPLELIMGAFRFFQLDLPTTPSDLYDTAYRQGILNDLENQGLNFYTPIDVAGYPPYHQMPAYNRNWITPNNLARRYQHIFQLLDGVENASNEMTYQLDIVAYVDDSTNITDPSNPSTLVSELLEFMYTTPVPAERFDYFLNDILLEGLSPSNWTGEWNFYKSTDDDTGVRPQLEKLIIAIIQTPEYQLF